MKAVRHLRVETEVTDPGTRRTNVTSHGTRPFASQAGHGSGLNFRFLIALRPPPRQSGRIRTRRSRESEGLVFEPVQPKCGHKLDLPPFRDTA